jgi:hypothetical protein
MPPSLAAALNVAVFAPLGWLGYGAGRRLGLRPPARFLLVALAAAGLGLAIETAQYVAANRHGLRWSFVTRHGGDVGLQVLGAVGGALAAAAGVRRR